MPSISGIGAMIGPQCRKSCVRHGKSAEDLHYQRSAAICGLTRLPATRYFRVKLAFLTSRESPPTKTLNSPGSASQRPRAV